MRRRKLPFDFQLPERFGNGVGVDGLKPGAHPFLRIGEALEERLAERLLKVPNPSPSVSSSGEASSFTPIVPETVTGVNLVSIRETAPE